ncbi:MAG: choline ABC transporter permease [Anaerolineae bacterium]|nr:ABC transporter permease subunit [Anaerolineales bacterium]MCQ3974184.1 choline ABC transporter permease [Anaerolineae bacterium]
MVNLQRLNSYFELRKRDWWILGAAVALILLVLALNVMPFEIGAFPAEWNLGLRQPIDALQSWIIGNRATSPLFVYFFDPLSDAIDIGIRAIEGFLLWLPWPVLLAGIFLLGQKLGGLRLALLSLLGFLYMGLIGLWEESMQTLALMGVSVIIALLIGIPLGILAARFPRFEAFLRPILDAMQTMPAFVYLIPVLLLFGVARVPSVVATVIYALPPAIRLTCLGIQQVPAATIEAATAFGSTKRQILLKVQLPLAMPAIIVGINQTIMMALGIVVIAALIGAGGLGREVLVALQRLQVGQGLEAGLAIVFMAIVLDRLSQAASKTEFASRPQQDHDFKLFPTKLARFDLIWSLEKGLDKLYAAFTSLTKAIATGLAAVISPLARALGQKNAAETIPGLLRTYAFGLTALLFLLLLLLVCNFVPGMRQFPESWHVSLRGPVDAAVAWSRDNLYRIGDLPIGTGPLSDFMTLYLLNPLRLFLQQVLPWVIVILAVALLAQATVGWRLALFTAIGMFVIGLLGMWEHAMDTLSQTAVAVVVALIIAIPVGILASRSDTLAAFLRPVLDTLQTIPPFIYLVPVIMLFNVGRVPGIIASVLYALPPAIRLTNLGIREVPGQTIEAARAFGSTPAQMLFKVQLPLALPSIMVGVNQTIMMVLSMVIIAGLVGGGGLGLETVIGLAKNQTGRGVEAGLAIVILAIVIDRITQAWGKKQQAGGQGH